MFWPFGLGGFEAFYTHKSQVFEEVGLNFWAVNLDIMYYTLHHEELVRLDISSFLKHSIHQGFALS